MKCSNWKVAFYQKKLLLMLSQLLCHNLMALNSAVINPVIIHGLSVLVFHIVVLCLNFYDVWMSFIQAGCGANRYNLSEFNYLLDALFCSWGLASLQHPDSSETALAPLLLLVSSLLLIKSLRPATCFLSTVLFDCFLLQAFLFISLIQLLLLVSHWALKLGLKAAETSVFVPNNLLYNDAVRFKCSYSTITTHVNQKAVEELKYEVFLLN